MADLGMIVAMVDLIRNTGQEPGELLVHPDDYQALVRQIGKRPIEIRGVPVRIDPDIEPGKVLAVA